MHFLFVLKLLFEKMGGRIFGDHNFPSGDQKFLKWNSHILANTLIFPLSHYSFLVAQKTGMERLDWIRPGRLDLENGPNTLSGGQQLFYQLWAKLPKFWLKGSRQQGSTELSLNNTLWFSLPLVQFFFCFFLFVHSCTNITPLIYTYHICQGWSLHYNCNNGTEKSEMRDPCCLFRD